MKSPFPKIITVRRRKGMIDLTEHFREDFFVKAVVEKDEYKKEKFPEADIVDELPEIPIEIPDWLPEVKERKTLLSYFNIFAL